MRKIWSLLIICAISIIFFPGMAEASFTGGFHVSTDQYQQISRQTINDITQNLGSVPMTGNEQNYQKRVAEIAAGILSSKNSVKNNQQEATFSMGDRKINFPKNLSILNCEDGCFSGIKTIAQKVFSSTGSYLEEIRN